MFFRTLFLDYISFYMKINIQFSYLNNKKLSHRMNLYIMSNCILIYFDVISLKQIKFCVVCGLVCKRYFITNKRRQIYTR